MFRRLCTGLLTLFLAACSSLTQSTQPPPDSPASQTGSNLQSPISTPQSPISTLKNLGPAPALTNEVWLNTDTPLRLADLHGKVVLIDMWTFG